MYVCMFTYINIHTPPPPRLRLTYTRIHTPTCRIRPKTARGKIFWILWGRTRELGKIGGCNTSNLIFRISEEGGLPLVYHDEARGILFSAYYTPAATDAYRLLHTHTHTHTSHIHTRTYTHSDATTVKNLHV